MAVSELHHGNSSDKCRENAKAKDKKERPLTKIVVRRLPPSMDQETFLVQVSPLPEYDYIYMVKGDMSLGEHAYSRAYINFVNASDIFTFKEKFDNYVFVDQKGHEYPAVVEFATFQKIPRKRKPRQDPKAGTVESDTYYAEFLESLKAQPLQEQKPEYSYQFNTESKEEVASTPLLDFVKQRRIDKLRIREERREQRKLRELERKKLREEEHKRRQEQKLTARSSRTSKSLDTVTENTAELTEKTVEDEPDSEKSSTVYVPKDKKFSYSNSKPRFYSQSEKAEFYDKRSEYKKSGNRKDDFYRDKEYRNRRFDEYKKDTPRKARRYSEKAEVRKRAEEGFYETKGTVEEKKEDLNSSVQGDELVRSDSRGALENQSSVEDDSKDRSDTGEGNRDDPRTQRRIRNKDRPTMAIYQPGALSKRRTDVPEETPSTTVKE